MAQHTVWPTTTLTCLFVRIWPSLIWTSVGCLSNFIQASYLSLVLASTGFTEICPPSPEPPESTHSNSPAAANACVKIDWSDSWALPNLPPGPAPVTVKGGTEGLAAAQVTIEPTPTRTSAGSAVN